MYMMVISRAVISSHLNINDWLQLLTNCKLFAADIVNAY